MPAAHHPQPSGPAAWHRLAAAVCLGVSLWGGSTTAQAATLSVGGVPYEEHVQLGGANLLLNGAGIRYKTVFRVYAAGLYLPAKASTTEEVIAQNGPKRIAITMLRDIDANELGKLFTKGVEENTTRAEYGPLLPGLISMGKVFADQKQLKAGDTFFVDWVPNVGTQVVVHNKPAGAPVREAAFFTAMLKIWLGATPADFQLKDALLGKSSG